MQLKEKVFKVLVDNNLFDKNYVAAISQIAKILHVKKQDVVDAFKDLQTDKLICFRNKRVCTNAEYKSGIITVFPNKTGYVKFEGDNKEYFIPDVKDANNGDTVKVCINVNAPKPTAFVSKVTARCQTNIMGRVVKKENYYYFVPDNRRLGTAITIPQDQVAKDAVGKKCCLTATPTSNLKSSVAYGTITKIMGMAGDPIIENVAIAESYGFVKEFPKEVEDYVRNLPTEVLDNEREGRKDLTDKKFFTIDPANCKDMDDAVCLEKLENGNSKLYVAIADVSHYVPKSSPLDLEARKRSTSSYLGDGVYPMLCEVISSGVCSLKPKVDRLVKIVELEIDPQGQVVNREFYNAVINSKHKLSYEQAEDIHQNKNNAHIEYADIKTNIDAMYKVSRALLNDRLRKGELRFETDEVNFELDETKTSVLKVSNALQLLESTEIIESFMIIANNEVGKFLLDKELPVLLRTLIGPNASNIKNLNAKLAEFDIQPLRGQSDYKRLVRDINRHPLKDYLTLQVLRSIGKAIYEPDQNGHFCFGPTVRTYLHFTAPIRRYPDLIVHRILESVFENIQSPYTQENLVIEGLIASKRELDAQHAEMDSNKLMKSMWAENQIGKQFEGQIFDITESCIIVKLENKVEISVPFNSLAFNSQIKVNESRTKIKAGSHVYKIGDSMTVSIQKADRVSKSILAKEERQLQNINVQSKEL